MDLMEQLRAAGSGTPAAPAAAAPAAVAPQPVAVAAVAAAIAPTYAGLTAEVLAQRAPHMPDEIKGLLMNPQGTMNPATVLEQWLAANPVPAVGVVAAMAAAPVVALDLSTPAVAAVAEPVKVKATRKTKSKATAQDMLIACAQGGLSPATAQQYIVALAALG